jgi:hypothetical protein
VQAKSHNVRPELPWRFQRWRTYCGRRVADPKTLLAAAPLEATCHTCRPRYTTPEAREESTLAGDMRNLRYIKDGAEWRALRIVLSAHAAEVRDLYEREAALVSLGGR